MQVSQIRRHTPPSQMPAVAGVMRSLKREQFSNPDAALEELDALGIGFGNKTAASRAQVIGAMDASVQDDAQGMYLSASPNVTNLKLLAWAPGYVGPIFQVLRSSEALGETTIGRWFDKSIIVPVFETSGRVGLYSDIGNPPLSNVQLSYNQRDIVVFEAASEVGVMEEAQLAEMNMSASSVKRAAAARAIAQNDNLVSIYGASLGARLVYGMLNDPNLPAYLSNSVPWSSASATFATVTGLFVQLFAALQVQTGGNVDPEKVQVVCVIPTGHKQYLNVPNTLGLTPLQWLKTNYPAVKLIDMPQLSGANGGQSVIYAYAETISAEDDSSTDGGAVWLNAKQAKVQTIGVEKFAKLTREVLIGATAGAILKRPVGIVRATNI